MIKAYCPACWREVPVGASDCAACGADLEALDAADFDEKLVRALRHPEPGTAVRAAEILGWRRRTAAVPALVQRWRDGVDPYFAAAIAQALGRIGGRDAFAALRVMAEDPSAIVKAATRAAMLVRKSDEVD